MQTDILKTELRAGTLGGTLVILLTNLGEDILRTAVLSTVAAIMSFLVSWALRSLITRWEKPK